MDQYNEHVSIHIASVMQYRKQCSETENKTHPDKSLPDNNTSSTRLTQESEEQMQRYAQTYNDNSSAVESYQAIALRL